MSSPPLLPPRIASFSGRAHFCLIKYSAASANVRHNKNAAAVEPKPAREVEIRLHADAVAAIAIKQRRIVTVELCAFSANDVQRDFRAVLRRRELPRHFD